MSPLKNFAERERLRTRRSQDGSLQILGASGEIYDYGSGLLAVMLTDLTTREWAHRKRVGRASGMTVIQDGDVEGVLTFDPTVEEQAQIAIRFARARRKRQLSESTRERLRKMMEGHAFKRKPDATGAGFPVGQETREVLDG